MNFINLILGTTNYSLFFACMFFGFLTATLKLGLEVRKGVRKSEISPSKFDWRYFWRDGNGWRLFISGTSIFILIRFMDWIIAISPLSGISSVNNDNTRMFISMLIGLGSDAGINKLRQIGMFGTASKSDKK